MNSFKEIKPLSNFDIIQKCRELKIKNFKGVLMRDELKGKASKSECLILNIDDSSGNCTHWTSLFSTNGLSYYFDSYGFEPPNEVRQYCSNNENFYNSFKIQKTDEVICGHYCIYVIYQLNKGMLFYDILDELYKKSFKINNHIINDRTKC